MNGWLSITPNHQQFAFFFTAAFAAAAMLLVHNGLRGRWRLLPWLAIMRWGVTLGFIGSKLMLIPVGGWLAESAKDTSMKSPLSSSEFDSPPESVRYVPV